MTDRTREQEPHALCLVCHQPVTWSMWNTFTPCPASKRGHSGHLLECSPESLGRIVPKTEILANRLTA